jgi:hypothetical protein
MSESDSWSDHERASDTADGQLYARAVAEQMKTATSKLRARLSVVRQADHGGGQGTPAP